ncbi:hypothetical protein BDV95DRAFT_484215 [Massariosphaeria phaeospora]|uniref:RNB domain-containing protein n=1 Tax=Massariosphaeria phaeospora TaxID=100035 RepID=A0A7C8MHZ5_9PLEO|nr:hypothetical protein BDV95DRAFT_484215 [Massariosphaeria phaeospora]
MYPRNPWPTAGVCWKCQWQLAYSSPRLPQKLARRDGLAPRSALSPPRRAFHATRKYSKPSLAAATASETPNPALLPGLGPQNHPIREHLQLWQQSFGQPSEETLRAFENFPVPSNIHNDVSRMNYSAKADEAARDQEDMDEEGNEGEDLITIGLFLEPGDAVELSTAGREPVLAVFVQQFNDLSQFLSINGRWCHSRLATISFAIPGCIDPKLLQPLLPYLPTNPLEAAPKGEVQVPRDAIGPIQDILGRLTGEAEHIYRSNAAVLDNAYSKLADPTRTRMMTLTQIAKKLLGRNDPAWTPSSAALLAVRKALHQNVFRFRSDNRSQRLTNVFGIRPKNDVQVVESVHGWVREYQEHQALIANTSARILPKPSKQTTYIADFIEKACRLIAISRNHREPNAGFLGPSSRRLPLSDRSSSMQAVWGEEFTSSDKEIINFLQAWVLTKQFNQMNSLHSACTSILQATKAYDDKINHYEENRMGQSTGHLFLQEIGVLTPHENRAIYDEQLMLPTVRLSRNLELLNTKAELTRRSPDFRDSMAKLRRDWGTTNVYCIDDAGAKEIDDGVSIAKIAGNDEQYWVHVHIANPTAFFDKTHVLSGLSAHMTETVYTPERAFPMLPPWVSQNYFSLGRDRPVITFSSRIDLSGAILETKIQHGIVRNVFNITPAELSASLSENTEVEVKRMVVGGEVPLQEAKSTGPELSSTQVQELRDLYTVARALWKGRKAAGGVRIGIHKTEVRLFENLGRAGLAWTPPSVDRARLVHGDPIIEVSARASKSSLENEIDSRNIVEEVMLLACQSAASWCAKRSIPVMYRGTIATSSSDVKDVEQFRQEVVNPYMDKHGQLSLALGFKYIHALGRAIAHSSPLPHRIIGAQSYLKVTSPLRRFSDMIAHWQIEAALRYEAETGKTFDSHAIANTSRPILPFSQRQMQESITTLSPREKIISQTQSSSTHFWSVQAFMRAFYYNETPLPETFKVMVRSLKLSPTEASLAADGYLTDLNVRVILRPADGVVYQIGDEWEVKMNRVDVFTRIIKVDPIRLLQRDPDFV